MFSLGNLHSCDVDSELLAQPALPFGERANDAALPALNTLAASGCQRRGLNVDGQTYLDGRERRREFRGRGFGQLCNYSTCTQALWVNGMLDILLCHQCLILTEMSAAKYEIASWTLISLFLSVGRKDKAEGGAIDIFKRTRKLLPVSPLFRCLLLL